MGLRKTLGLRKAEPRRFSAFLRDRFDRKDADFRAVLPETDNPIGVPPTEALLTQLRALASASETVATIIAASERGAFVHPDGRTDDFGGVTLKRPQAALLCHLAQSCPVALSLEVGFGMGSTATIIIASRLAAERPFEHMIFDPYGLPNGRGKVVRAYLEQQFAGHFRLIEKRSEIGLAQVLDQRGPRTAGFVFIDGSHHYENIMADFVLADLLCCRGGYIVFDDALFPAIETVLSYIAANRPDYALAHLPVHNTSVIKKTGADNRPWSDFKPFRVPERRDWEAAKV